MSESHSKTPRPILKKARESAETHAGNTVVWDEDNLALNESEKVPRMTIDEPKTPYHRPGEGSPALSADGHGLDSSFTLDGHAAGAYVGSLPHGPVPIAHQHGQQQQGVSPALHPRAAALGGSPVLSASTRPHAQSACATADGMPKLFTRAAGADAVTGAGASPVLGGERPMRSALKRPSVTDDTGATDVGAPMRVDTPPLSDDDDDEDEDEDEGEREDPLAGMSAEERAEAEASQAAFEAKRKAHYNMKGLLGRPAPAAEDDDDDEEGEGKDGITEHQSSDDDA